MTTGAAFHLAPEALGVAQPAGGGGDEIPAHVIPGVLAKRCVYGEQRDPGTPGRRCLRQIPGDVLAEQVGQGGQVGRGDDPEASIDAPAIGGLDTHGSAALRETMRVTVESTST